jgi:hypothetical protein
LLAAKQSKEQVEPAVAPLFYQKGVLLENTNGRHILFAYQRFHKRRDSKKLSRKAFLKENL